MLPDVSAGKSNSPAYDIPCGVIAADTAEVVVADDSADVIERLLQSLQLSEVNHISTAVGQVRAELPGLLKIPVEKIEAMSDAEAGVRWYTIYGWLMTSMVPPSCPCRRVKPGPS